jgi:hypothetical protein
MSQREQLLAAYNEWQRERVELSERESIPGNLPSSGEWQASDDAGIELLHGFATYAASLADDRIAAAIANAVRANKVRKTATWVEMPTGGKRWEAEKVTASAAANEELVELLTAAHVDNTLAEPAQVDLQAELFTVVGRADVEPGDVECETNEDNRIADPTTRAELFRAIGWPMGRADVEDDLT